MAEIIVIETPLACSELPFYGNAEKTFDVFHRTDLGDEKLRSDLELSIATRRQYMARHQAAIDKMTRDVLFLERKLAGLPDPLKPAEEAAP